MKDAVRTYTKKKCFGACGRAQLSQITGVGSSRQLVVNVRLRQPTGEPGQRLSLQGMPRCALERIVGSGCCVLFPIFPTPRAQFLRSVIYSIAFNFVLSAFVCVSYFPFLCCFETFLASRWSVRSLQQRTCLSFPPSLHS